MGLMDTIVQQAEAARASDVHIAAGVPIRFRVDGKLVLPEAIKLLKVAED